MMNKYILRRRHFSRFVLAILLLAPMLCSLAMQSVVMADSQESSSLPYYISDVAGLMTENQWQQLENSAEQISEQYGCGVYVVTLDDYTNYGSCSSYWDFSEKFYSGYHLGLGEEHNGILLIMSMAERDYSLIAYGNDAHYAFTDYGKEVLENHFLDNFRQNDWYGGFSDYVEGCGELLERAASGEPLDISYDSDDGVGSAVSTAAVIGVPLISAFGACEGMRRQMKPVSRKSRASDYVVPGSINLSVKRDVFVNQTVTHVHVPRNDRDSHRDGGGGGTTVNSHGFSGHSGKF